MLLWTGLVSVMNRPDLAHSAKPENGFAHDGALAAQIQAARDVLMCDCDHKNVSHGYGDETVTTWREGSLIGLGPCGIDGCTCQHFSEITDDPERFCDFCLAGLKSSEHEEKCGNE